METTTGGGPGSIPAIGGIAAEVCGGGDWVRSTAAISSETKKVDGGEDS